MSAILSIDAGKGSSDENWLAIRAEEKKGGKISFKYALRSHKSDANKLALRDNLRFSFSYDGVITENIDIPPVKSDKSKVFLFKNKMKDRLKPGAEYSLIFFENPGKAEPPKINYTVYAAPADIVKEYSGLSKNSLKAVESFTFDFFSVMGVSNAFDPSSLIFHAYGDDKRVIVVVSSGLRADYYRISEVPQGMTAKEELDNFYYENINLTYMYVRQTFSNKSMKVLLTGKLAGDAALKQYVEAFADHKIYEADPAVAGNVSLKTFHEFLIPIGTALLGGRCDFSGALLKEERRFHKALKYINAGLALLTAPLALFLFSVYSGYLVKKDYFETRSRSFLQKERELVNNIGNKSLLKYKYVYLKAIEDKKKSPLFLLAPSQGIAAFYKFSAVTFSGRGSEASVSFQAEEGQNSFSSLEEFNKKISEKIAEAESFNIRAADGSIHTLKELKNKINVTMTAGSGNAEEQ